MHSSFKNPMIKISTKVCVSKFEKLLLFYKAYSSETGIFLVSYFNSFTDLLPSEIFLHCDVWLRWWCQGTCTSNNLTTILTNLWYHFSDAKVSKKGGILNSTMAFCDMYQQNRMANSAHLAALFCLDWLWPRKAIVWF